MNLSETEIVEFKQEALELLDGAEAALLEISRGAPLANHYDAIFRSLHSVKGAAGVINMTDLRNHVHEIETFFSGLKGVESLDATQVDYLLNGCDRARELLGVSNGSATEASPSAAPALDQGIIEFIAEAKEVLARLNQCVSQAEKEGNNKELIAAIYRDVHTVKGSALLFGLLPIGNLGHAMESHMESYRENAENFSASTIDTLYKSFDLMEKMVDAIPRGNLKDFEADSEKLTQLFTTPNKVLEMPSPAPQEPVAVKVEKASEPVPDSKSEAQTSLRISVSILDSLMALMGEMVLVRNQVIQYSNNNDDLEFINLSQRLDVVTSEMQAEVMKTRMQPIGSILTKFQRVVRDLAKELNKKIDITFIGNETELDKALLEAVKDPLMHIVRNSCDHGLEAPADRQKLGKPEMGQIRIKSAHEGGQVIIEISDDGKGLNKDVILKKAIERNLVTADKAAQLSEKDIFNFIFAPGFSTAKAVTNVSGRGVGMDVVRKNIERIGGHVDIHSSLNQGTTIRLKIPLTLAIVPAMIIKSGQRNYAIPQVKLVELVCVEKGKNAQAIEFLQGKPVYRLRGNLLPMISLSEALGGKKTEDLDEVTNIVVVNADTVTFGLVVDEVLDTADIVVKPLIHMLKSLDVYSGATVLGDGSISLILDVLGIAQSQKLTTIQGEERSSLKSGQSFSEYGSMDQVNEFLLVRLSNGQKHALPLSVVNRMEEFHRSQLERSGDVSAVRYRDTILPLLNLSTSMNLSKGENLSNSDKVQVIVTRFGGRLVGLEVDEILDVITSMSHIDDSFRDRESILGNIVHQKEIIAVVDTHQILTGSPIFKDSEKQKSSVGKRKKILFAEDTEFFRRHVSKVLTAAGYDVVTAENGQQAYSILKSVPQPENEFSLVLSDIEMPEMNGLELAKAVRADAKMANLKLIALTTRYSDQLIQEGLAAGFDSYLEKLNPETLLAQIQKCEQMTNKEKVA